VAAPTNFIQLSTVNYNPANASSVQAATRATLTAASGFLATNVAAVKFDFTTPAPENGFCGYSEIGVFGSLPLQQPAPYLLTNTLPAVAVDVVGSQVIFTAAFNSANLISYQWQRIKSGVTNDIVGATNTTLTLNNLQLADAANYQLRASNVLGIAVSTPSSLTVNSVPAAVNNVITSMAAQLGIAGTIYFAPTWNVPPSSLIAGQAPNSIGAGGFSQAGSGTTTVLTDGIFGALNYQAGIGGPSAGVTSCGGSAGQSVIYTLTGSATGYNLTNIIVYGGWGDAGRDQQAYTISYSKITAPTNFISLGSVNYNPSNPSSTLSGTRATLTAAVGALATNVAAVKFDFTTPAPENGYCGYGEILLFGTPSPQPVRWAVGNGNWDAATPNWKSFLTPVNIGYLENNLTALDDSATGSSPITVTLTGNHSPSVLTNNSTKNYILAGGFSITGGSLVKNGAGSLILDNGAANNFTAIQINSGNLQIGNNDTNGSLGASGVSNNGSLIFNRTDSLNVGNVISGTGSFAQNGSGTVVLSASNSYSGNTTVSAGTLALSGAGAIPASAQIAVFAGAILDASSRSDQTLTLSSGKSLKGSGSVLGQLNALANSVVNPGDTIGTLTVQSNVTLNGLLQMELNRTNVQTADRLISTTGSVAASGTLTVTNLGPALVAGDTFQLFSQPVSGFATLNLPDVSPNAWVNLLTNNGTIYVLATSPTNLAIQFTAGNLTLNWPSDHTGWRLQVQTNDVSQGLGTNWTEVADATTTNQLTVPINPESKSVFYRLVFP
jgi:autotransporter-associated beta strand protein